MRFGSNLKEVNEVQSDWESTLRQRFERVFRRQPIPLDSLALSVKARVKFGCFHREHSPRAYEIIDEYLAVNAPKDTPFVFEEHESGPEILLWLAAIAGAFSFSASIVNLVTAIIKARSEGVRRGDGRQSPVELVVRGFTAKGIYFEEMVLRFEAGDAVSRDTLEKALNSAIPMPENEGSKE
jgi:hypothetical protein